MYCDRWYGAKLQLSITKIGNQRNRLACNMQIERNGTLTGLVIEGTAWDAYFMPHKEMEDALKIKTDARSRE